MTSYSSFDISAALFETILFCLQLDPATLWLKEEFGWKAYFPNPLSNTFTFNSEVRQSVISFVVEGMATKSLRSHVSVLTPPTTLLRPANQDHLLLEPEGRPPLAQSCLQGRSF